MLLYRKRCLHESQKKTLWLSFVRSSRSQMFLKIDVLKNFANFTEKNLCCNNKVSLRNKVSGLKVWNVMKKRLQRRCFPVKFQKLLRALFFLQNTCSDCFWKRNVTSLAKIFQSCHLFEINQRCFRKIAIKKNNE